MTNEASDDLYPEPTFWVYTPSGRAIGYGSRCDDDLWEIYPPGGDDEGWMGLVCRAEIEFSSGVLAGRIEGAQIYYDDEGVLAGEIRGNQCFNHEGKVVARIEGEGTQEAFAGAVLLLVFVRWFKADGSLNTDLQ